MTVRDTGRTAANYSKPYRPRAIAIANGVGRALSRVGVGTTELSVDGLVAAARKKTALTGFGDESFREPLGVLVDSIEREANLTPVGRLITKVRLEGVLCNRLRAEALFERYPAILEEEIVAPLFVAGLQRTGTTMLHRLLAQDPGMRSLASWEALNPAPLSDPHRKPLRRKGRDPRIRTAVVGEKGLAYMAPDFFAIHPVEAEAPEEEVILLDFAFLSTVAESTLHVPTYARWLETQDQTPAYAYMKKLLQLLQWQRRKERWILKTPHHLEWLDTLLDVFPDAKIVQTHRDPAKTMASFCSMIAHGRGVFSDDVDPCEVGAHWSRKIQRLVSRGMETRDHAPVESFLDVSYYDLINDPMAEVERIYRFTGRELSCETRELMERSRNVNQQNKHGKHAYRLEDFGLDRAAIEPGLAAYRARHAIRHE
jgi:hypothetical protein